MIQKQVVIKNLTVNYYFARATDDTVPTVVFLHGWRNNARVWLPVFKLLAETPYSFYALDLPGFGASDVPDRAWKLADYLEVVKSFVERMQLGPAVIVGHSFGGKIAAKLAVVYPELVKKLVLVNSSGIRREAYQRRIITFFAKLLRPVFALPVLRKLRPRIYYILGADDYLATPELKTTFLNIVTEDLREILPKISQDTLLIWGDRDTETPLRNAHLMQSLIPNSKIVIFSGAGHFSFLDQPGEFTKVLINFLNESH